MQSANPTLPGLTKVLQPLVRAEGPARPTAEDKAAYQRRRDQTRKSLSRALRTGEPILLEGDSPSTKLSLLRSVRWPDDPPLCRVSAMAEPSELFGNVIAVGNEEDRRRGTLWRDGALTEAVHAPKWLVVDEVQNARPELAEALAGLAQPKPQLRIHKGPGREEILCPDVDAGFRLILITGLALFRSSTLESVLPERLLRRLIRIQVERPPLGMRLD